MNRVGDIMQSKDEEIAANRIEERKEKTQTINDIITINDMPYNFLTREFSLGFSMVVPESFSILDQYLAKIKFPNEERPQIIIASDDTTVCLAFDSDNIETENLQKRTNRYISIIKRLNPSYIFYSQKVYQLSSGLEVATYDFLSFAIDTDIYNFNFFTDLPDKELLGWFNCPADLREQWEPLVRQMIQTIEIAAHD